MYASLLTRRYLTKRIMPLLASIAVMLCTAMIIIVWSVMTGWLGQVTDAGRTFLGDVMIVPPTNGLPYYDDLCHELEILPEVQAAAPQLDTFGLLNLPADQVEPVQVVGIVPETYNAVTGYKSSLFWVGPEPEVDDKVIAELDELKRILLSDAGVTVEYALRLLSDDKNSAENTLGDAWNEHVINNCQKAVDLYSDVITWVTDRHIAHKEFNVTEMLKDRRSSAQRAARLAKRIFTEKAYSQAKLERLKELINDAGTYDFRLGLTAKYLEAGESLSINDDSGETQPAIVLGIEVSKFNKLQRDGSYNPRFMFLPGNKVTLSVVPLDGKGGVLEPERRRIMVANEFRSGLYEADSNRVFIPLTVLQQMMHWQKAVRVVDDASYEVEFDELGMPESFDLPQKTVTDPARVSAILVKGVDGVADEDLRRIVSDAYRRFALEKKGVPLPGFVRVYTWREQVSSLISAIETQRALMLTMFIFISFTAVFLVFAIFWSIVSEKTKDIGTLRALGASGAGVAWVFLRYGLIVGIIGSIAGVILASVFVANINEIHEMVGRATGLYVWRAEVYQFARIPGKVDFLEASVVMFGGVLSSVIGSLAPAIKAASLDPIKALNFE